MTAVGTKFRGRLAAAVVVSTICVGFIGAGVAYADVGFSVPSPTGLTDGQSVQIVLTGINAVPLATVDISECANAYTDSSPLPALNPATDCQDLGQIDVSQTQTVTTSVTVIETGIGLGNRSCISAGNFSCDLRVSQMKNQLTSPLPQPVTISFASDPPPGTAEATTTVVSETGAPAAHDKPAWAHVQVATAGSFVPEGTVTVALDGVDVATAPIGDNASADIPVGTPDLGNHTLDARFDGNGSFASSTASTASFDVIAATNISVGDTSVVEGNTGVVRKIFIPIVLSQRSLSLVTVHYSVDPGTATNPADYTVAGLTSGTMKFAPGVTIKYVTVKVNGDTIAEGNQTFSVNLSSPTAGWDLRRASGTGTIIDDDPGSGVPTVGIGDASMPEGDIGGTHSLKLPLTLSDPQFLPVIVNITLTSVSAVHSAPHRVGDWGGPILRRIKIPKGQVWANVSIPTYPDTNDEPNLVINATITSVTALFPVGVARPLATATILSDE